MHAAQKHVVISVKLNVHNIFNTDFDAMMVRLRSGQAATRRLNVAMKEEL